MAHRQVYHGTTRQGAEEIESTWLLKSAGEPHVYVTTDPRGGTYSGEDTGYGDGTVVTLLIDERLLELDDEFPSGRQDFRVSVGHPGGSVPVMLVGVAHYH